MTNIHVLIPSYNCAEWIERTLDSVQEQTFQPRSVLLIDDASDQLSYAQLALQQCQNRGFSYLRNAKNEKCPYNLWLGVKVLDPEPEDVIFLLDGDDFLPGPETFQRIAEVYSDPDVWLTYGNYEPHPVNTGQVPASSYDSAIIRNRDFRKSGNFFNHPITFRRFLFDEIRDEDLKTKDGRWFRGGYDFAIMMPMLEMCGQKHYRFLDEVLYIYNAVNPISDSHVNVKLINETDQLRARPKRELLIR